MILEKEKAIKNELMRSLNLTVSAGPNPNFNTLIDDSCITDETIIGHDVITGVVIEKYPFLRSHGFAGSHGRDSRSSTAGAVILQGMLQETSCIHPQSPIDK